MEFLSNKPLLITDTILRDAHQSQAATRMTTEDMLARAGNAGFHRLLLSGVLGRRNLRRLYAFPE
ncbi:MAG: hypothetical protein ACLSHO_11035 [Dysosmobacter sp.]